MGVGQIRRDGLSVGLSAGRQPSRSRRRLSRYQRWSQGHPQICTRVDRATYEKIQEVLATHHLLVKDLLLQALRRYVEVEEAFDGAGSAGEVEELCKKADACAVAAVAKVRVKKAEQELKRVEAELQQANAALLRLKKQIAKYCPKCPDYKEIRRELIKAGILKPKPF